MNRPTGNFNNPLQTTAEIIEALKNAAESVEENSRVFELAGEIIAGISQASREACRAFNPKIDQDPRQDIYAGLLAATSLTSEVISSDDLASLQAQDSLQDQQIMKIAHFFAVEVFGTEAAEAGRDTFITKIKQELAGYEPRPHIAAFSVLVDEPAEDRDPPPSQGGPGFLH